MELDDLKATWHALDRRLQQHDAINLQLLDKARSQLRPLFWGQVVQMAFGALIMFMAIACWSQNRHIPVLLVSGLVMHAYGVLAMAMGGVTLGMIQGIDYGEPIVAIQKRLARLRRFHLLGGMLVGLPWWVLWMPMLFVLAGLRPLPVAQSAATPIASWVLIALGGCVAGLLATLLFHRWARQPVRSQLGQRLDDAAAGHGIRRMQSALDEIARFEQE